MPGSPEQLPTEDDTMATRKKMGRPLNPKWREWRDKLGTVSDRVIAERMGVSQQIVSTRRRALGIPACRKWGKLTQLS